MKKKLNLREKRGMTIIETVIYLTLSAVIICCTLTVMLSMIRRTDEEDKSSYRLNKLYSALNIIEGDVCAHNAKIIAVKNNSIAYVEKNNIKNNKCDIDKFGNTIRLRINGVPLYYMNNEQYNCEVKTFECFTKGNLLYINVKLKTGEMMNKCIHIDQ